MQDTRRATPSWAERWVRFLDDGFTIPGTSIRLGADAVLGFFVPAVGDSVSALMSASLFALALQRRVPPVVLARMLVNVCLDTVFGSVPLLGDVFDVMFKANRKNLTLIEQHDTPHQGHVELTSYVIVGAAVLLLLTGVAIPLLLTWWLATGVMSY